MKKTLTAMTLLAGAVSVYSQGSIAMSDYYSVGSGPLSVIVQVFGQDAPLAGTFVSTGAGANQSGYEVMGNTLNTYNAVTGGAVYHAAPIGGATYDVGLLGAAGNVLAGGYSGLSLVGGSVVNGTWYGTKGAPTGNGNYGVWLTANVATVPNVTSGGLATIAIAAWQNTGAQGAATTLAAAQTDGYTWGVSGIVTDDLTFGAGTPVNLPTTLQSFSLATTVPEPSTIALGVIGASALLFRRKK